MISNIPPLTSIEWLGIVAVISGILLFAIGEIAEKWHNKEFKRHTDNLGHLYDKGDNDAIRKEVQRFHNDKWVDIATWAMFWMMITGVTLIAIGLFLFLS